jgi:glycosyltransferase involved in cell wall biosynthesis
VRGAYKLLPGHRATRESASAILIASKHTLALEASRHHGKCIYLPENAIDPVRFNLRADIPNDGPLKVCFVGRLVPYKGVDMLLEAARPLVDQALLEVDVVGDGPMRPRVEALAGPHLGAAIRLHGWLPHDQVQNVLAANHVLGFPSIREFGGGVVLEAMALGVVPMIVDYAGPAELVTEATGFKIPLGERDSIVQSFRMHLSKVAGERDMLRVMSSAGRATVHSKYTWAAKAEQIRLVYDWVCAGGEKPMPFAVYADPTLVASRS